MPNDFYTPTGNPPDGGLIVSADMRAEFAAILAGFNKMPALIGNANKIVVVNSSGSGLDATETLGFALTVTESLSINSVFSTPALNFKQGGTMTGAITESGGDFYLRNAGSHVIAAFAQGVSAPTSYVVFRASDAGIPRIYVTGVPNADLQISSTGTGSIVLSTSPVVGEEIQVKIPNTVAADRWISMTGGNSAASGIATISTGGTAGGSLLISSATGNVAIGGTAYATSGLVVGSTGQANHVVITDSATNPTISTNAGGLQISAFNNHVGIGIAPLTNVGCYTYYVPTTAAASEYGGFQQVALNVARGSNVTIGCQSDINISTGYSASAGYAATALTGSITVANAGITVPAMYGVHGFLSASAASTITEMVGVKSTVINPGASTITFAYGFYVADVPAAATAAYGYYSNVSSGAGKYALCMAGTALNYFGGDIQTAGNVYVPGAATPIFRTSATITGGSGANSPTLGSTAPNGGTPKWIPISDNGTTRYIPAW